MSCLPVMFCCACGSATSCASSLCSSITSLFLKKEQAAKIMYALNFILVSIIAWIFSVWAKNILYWVPIELSNENCFSGALIVYCFTCALFLFHIFLFFSQLKVTSTNDWLAQIHLDFFIMKALLLLCLIALTFFLPRIFLICFGWLATFGALLFIFLQLLLLINFSYDLNNQWVRNYEEATSSKKLYASLLLCTTLFCYAIAIALTIVMYVFHMGPKSWESPFFVTINIFLCFFISTMSVHPAIQRAHRSTPVGLLQSAIVSCYVTYLVFSGLKDATVSQSLETTNMIIGSIFVLICVGFTTFRIGGSRESYNLIDEDSHASATSETDTNIDDAGELSKEETKPQILASSENDAVSYNYAFFHIIFALGATYICKLLTGWVSPSKIENSDCDVHDSVSSMWIKIITSWVACVLHFWSIIAPIFIPSREW